MLAGGLWRAGPWSNSFNSTPVFTLPPESHEKDTGALHCKKEKPQTPESLRKSAPNWKLLQSDSKAHHPPRGTQCPHSLRLSLHRCYLFRAKALSPLPNASRCQVASGILDIVWVSCGYHSKSPQTWWWYTADIYSLSVLEVRSLKSRCLQPWLLLWALRENPCPASLLASGGFTTNPWCSLAHGHITPTSPSIFAWCLLWVWVCVFSRRLRGAAVIWN